MAMEWTPQLAVGHETIDGQHQELFRRFSDLLQACKQQRGKEQVVDLLDFLGNYVATHFQVEERLMDGYNYPGAEAHKTEHVYFTGRLMELRENLQHRGPSSELVITTNMTLLDWIIRHIKQVDVQLGAFLKGR